MCKRVTKCINDISERKKEKKKKIALVIGGWGTLCNVISDREKEPTEHVILYTRSLKVYMRESKRKLCIFQSALS